MPVKILYLQATSEIGGSDISLFRIVEKLNRKDFIPCVGVPCEGPLTEKLRALGVQVQIFPRMMKLSSRGGWGYKLKYLFFYFPAVFQISSWIQREKIRLVHTNTLHNLHGWMAAKLAGVRHVWHVREIVKQSRLFLGLERFLARHFADRVIVTSDAVSEGFAPAEKDRRWLRKIPNGIDLEEFHPSNSGERILRDLKIPKATPLIGFVGRLDHWKGADVFLEAAALIRKKNTAARFLIVGGEVLGREDFARRLKRLSSELQLGDVVDFTDWTYQPSDMPEVYAALDIFVLPSTWPEPFGLVLLEAMASGKPVVATAHGGPLEICEEGKTAFLVPPKDAVKLSDSILFLLTHPERAREMGQAGRLRVEKMFNRIESLRELENAYRELLR